MTWLQQLVGDGEQPSTHRVLALAVVLPIMFVWSFLCIKKGDLIIPDQKFVALIITAIGGKTLGSLIEGIRDATAAKPPSAPATPAAAPAEPTPAP